MTRDVGSRKKVIIAVLLGVTVGLAAGVGAFTFVYARGASYLSNDPAVCANCHIMQNHLDAWAKSSHHDVAVCNDCHTPHNFFGKYYTKAINGWNHSLAFTTGNFHEPLQPTEYNQWVTEQACRYCHQDIVLEIDTFPRHDEPLSCIRCHDTVGHDEIR